VAGDRGILTVLTHLRWLVSDLKPCVAFYRDVLRLKQVVDVPGVYAEFDTGGAHLGLYRAALMADVVGVSAPASGDAAVACFRVANVDTAAARAREAGATLVTAPHDQASWMQRVAHLRDPAGHLVELWAPLARVS
jgi:catechol 2,3-dioxygenase-like lactoylglutathione lyase family enzyme